MIGTQAALAVCKSHLASCRDLVEEDTHEGLAPIFPVGFTEAQWDLILNCSIFKTGQEPKHRYPRKKRNAGRKRKGHEQSQGDRDLLSGRTIS